LRNLIGLLLLCLLFIAEAHGQATQTNAADTLSVTKSDSGATPTGLDAVVNYTANDSIRFDLIAKGIHLYGNSHVTYKDIDLVAGYIFINWQNNTVAAQGIPDSTGKVVQKPIFKQGDDEYRTERMIYNFSTRKAKVFQVTTKEGEGYLHSDEVKMVSKTALYIKNAEYTTCNLDHPHFYFRIGKAKVEPGSKIVAGPTYLVVEDMVTPLAIPFGIFPTKKGHRNGIILPNPGYFPSLGYGIKEGGYYWHPSEYVDFIFRADVYSLGSYALHNITGYKRRYKYSGDVSIDYSKTLLGDPDAPNFSPINNYRFRWRHQQDARANPYSRFNADVNVVTSRYNRLNEFNSTAYLNNSFNSSISYSYQFPNKPINLTAGVLHSQNITTHTLSISAPELNVNTQQINPFKRRNPVGDARWYEKVGVSYGGNVKATAAGIDSILLRSPGKFISSGVIQNIPFNTNFKLLKFYSLGLTAGFTERWYLTKENKQFDTSGEVLTTNSPTFAAFHNLNGNASLSTAIYGQLNFKGKIKAIRHVVQPSITYSYTPVLGRSNSGYVQRLVDSSGRISTYNIFQNNIIGQPTTTQASIVSFTLLNNIEAKVASKRDTVTGMKKVKIFDRLQFDEQYYANATRLKLSPLRITASSTIGQSNFNYLFQSQFQPYSRNPATYQLEDTLLVRNKAGLYHLESLSFTFGGNLRPKPATGANAAPSPQQQIQALNAHANYYVDFNVPYNLGFNYVINYTAARVQSPGRLLSQTIQLNGDVNVTRGWKIGFVSSYDFLLKQFSYTRFDFFRDLHCWELSLSWVPYGPARSYEVSLRPKASLLRDLRLQRRRGWSDFQ